MPHISKEKVQEIRKEIKAQFPSMKFSVTNDGSGVCVALMKSKFELPEYRQLNHYYLEQSGISEEAINVFKKVLEIINGVEAQRELTYDSDYGSVPTFYINIHIGKWNKAHEKAA